ncbi:MAG: phosphoribosylformylglycinamidine synthase subunit PurQ [Candidatus ainarchaeum sp.]|nr:phosphoribosylformylglycinamidine synthase subunit PurQ [Candidatus ainarchaeum sp.]
METHAAVLSGFGLNSEYETAYAIKLSGGNVDIIHLNQFIDAPSLLHTYNFLVLPGGFSYSDHLGAAKVFSNKLFFKLKKELSEFISEKKLILGICNGFQMLVKLGLLPYSDFKQKVTLSYNDSGKFEDRWVRLKANKNSPCIYTKDIDFFDLPVRHGEGKLIIPNQEILFDILNHNLFPLQYVDSEGKLSGYPFNPNGSINNIAGLCDPTGRIFGLMPHPECYNTFANHPLWTSLSSKEIREGHGLKIFKNAVNYLKTQ